MGHVVIACWDTIYEEEALKGLLLGRTAHLASQFRLTYAMILNLLRVEDLKVSRRCRSEMAGIDHGVHPCGWCFFMACCRAGSHILAPTSGCLMLTPDTQPSAPREPEGV